MNDLLDRLRKRRLPWLNTSAYAGNIASSAYMPEVSRSFTIDPSTPDADIDDAVKRIEALEANLIELLRLYDWRLKVGGEITKSEAIKYGDEKKAAWVEARKLVG